MLRSRIALGGLAAAVAAASLLFGGVLGASPDASGGRPAAAVAGSARPDAATTALVARLQGRVRGNPRDARSLTLLGVAYAQRLRETADPAYLTRADGVFRRALSLAPRSGPNHGIVGDALVELGRHHEAFAAFDRMAALEQTTGSYARVAYGRELIGRRLGRRHGAVEAMRLAVDAASGDGEPEAWARVELGKLYFGSGDVLRAEDQFRSALAVFPGYVYALDGLARVAAARGRYGAAIGLARRAVARVPLPQFVATLAELYRLTGRTRLARDQDRLVEAMTRLLTASGVRSDLELALYRVDHGVRLREALARARRAHGDRPGIEGDDVLGWALTRNGRCAEALRYARRSLRLGTRDALKYFHIGMAERCAGRDGAARTWFRRALALNPHFSILWAPVAREAIR